jgi:Sulfotransferase family
MTVAISLGQDFENLGRYVRRARFVLLPNRYGATGLLRARFNDAVFISLKRRYLFASNEKVANSTMRATFQSLECGGELPLHYQRFKRWTGPLLQPSDVADFPACLADPVFKRFCVVRHPYARLISCYRNKFEPKREGKPYRRKLRELGFPPHKDGISFSEFIHAIAKQNQTEMNSHWRIQYYNVFMDMIEYNEVIKYEAFNERLPGLIAELYPERMAHGEIGQAIITKNIQAESSDVLIERYFTPELKKIVREVYRRDFETFGYKG